MYVLYVFANFLLSPCSYENAKFTTFKSSEADIPLVLSDVSMNGMYIYVSMYVCRYTRVYGKGLHPRVTGEGTRSGNYCPVETSPS
jgi:hypothetical protein